MSFISISPQFPVTNLLVCLLTAWLKLLHVFLHKKRQQGLSICIYHLHFFWCHIMLPPSVSMFFQASFSRLESISKIFWQRYSLYLYITISIFISSIFVLSAVYNLIPIICLKHLPSNPRSRLFISMFVLQALSGI